MKEKLRPFHVGVLVYMVQIGVAIFSLPSQLARYFGTNGWLALIPLSLVAMLNIWLIRSVYRKSEGKSVVELLYSVCPKPVAYPILLYLMVTYAMNACLLSKQYVLIYEMLSFSSTDPRIFRVASDVLVFLLLIKGIHSISRAATVLLFITVWVNLFSFSHVKEMDLDRLTPYFFQGGSNNLFSGGMAVFAVFLGYEVCLFLFRYADSGSNWFRSVFVGHLGTTFSYLAVSFVAFGFYSFGQLKQIHYPILDMAGHIQLPVIERVDTLVIAVAYLLVFVTAAVYFWLASEMAVQLVPRLNRNFIIAFLLVSTFFISSIPYNVSQIQQWLKWGTRLAVSAAFGFPLLLRLLLLLPRRSGRGSA